MRRPRRPASNRLATIAVCSPGLLLLLLDPVSPRAAEPPPLAPDLELVALQTTGPGRIGDCNAVVARLHNSGAAPTLEQPEVRLQVLGGAKWSRTEPAPAPLAPGDTVEVWFRGVPIPGGRLSHLEATADPGDRIAESLESNNTRRVGREPRLACGAVDASANGGVLRVTVRRGAVGGSQPGPVAGAEVAAASPLGAGSILDRAATDGDGRARLALPADRSAPVVRVTVSAPGCWSEMRIVTPADGATVTDLDVELSCSGDAGAAVAGAARAAAAVTGADNDARGAHGAPAAAEAAAERPGVLEIEAALPGWLRLDDGDPTPVTPGSRVEAARPGAAVRVRAISRNGTVFHDATVAVPADRGRALLVDAPPLRSGAAGDVVEDLRSGLLWTVAGSAVSFAQAEAGCAALERAGAADWRLPDIDELAFLLAAAHQGGEALDRLPGLAGACCWWSTTEHALGKLTVYREGGHIYARNADESGVGALCVRGASYELDPLLVPERYRDRLPGRRTFRP